MPAVGYAVASLAADRLQQFLLLLYGHAANYQGRGSFFTTEQQSLYQLSGSSHWRASLGEVQDDFCTPSQTLVSSMTAMQLADSDRDRKAIWLARAAPRRWYNSSDGFAASNAPTRWGSVSFSINATEKTNAVVSVIQLKLSADFAQPEGTNMTTAPPELNVRIRDPTGKGRRLVATAEVGSDCGIAAVLQSAEMVQVAPPSGKADQIASCTIRVQFE